MTQQFHAKVCISQRIKAETHTDTCKHRFTAALFTVGKMAAT